MAVYVDANVLIYVAAGPRAGRGAWRDALTATQDPCTSVLALDEFVWATRRIIGKAAAVEQARMFLEWPLLQIVPIDGAVGLRALDLMDAGLDPRDAIHAATAITSGCTAILSDDPDFDVVAGLERRGADAAHKGQ